MNVTRAAVVNFTEIAFDLAFPEGPIAMPDGSVILVEIYGRTLKRVYPNGSSKIIASLDGGPNGAAMGLEGWCYICNSGGWKYQSVDGVRHTIGQSSENGWIERVQIDTGEVQMLYRKAGETPLRAPNDLVFDAAGGFWFTDHGKTLERTRDVTGIYYAKADGSMIEEVVFPMMTPNGIGLSPDETVLYVAETQTRSIWAFDIEAPGKIRKLPWPSRNGGRLLAGLPDNFLPDSMAVDSDGNICVATLREGGIMEISPDGSDRKHYPFPDPFCTNICFGGAGLKTAYITLSGTGRLAAVDWHRAGLPLNYLNK